MVDSASAGDTAYVLDAALVLQLGNEATGRRLWVANVDAANQVTVETSGSIEGIKSYNLTGAGDAIIIPGGDVTLVTITASAYPTTIGWAFLAPHSDIGSGITRV